jgi:hypothetical protein
MRNVRYLVFLLVRYTVLPCSRWAWIYLFINRTDIKVDELCKSSFEINVLNSLIIIDRWNHSEVPRVFLFSPRLLLIYAFGFREGRFYWPVNNGYYAQRRIPGRLRTPSGVI